MEDEDDDDEDVVLLLVAEETTDDCRDLCKNCRCLSWLVERLLEKMPGMLQIMIMIKFG